MRAYPPVKSPRPWPGIDVRPGLPRPLEAPPPTAVLPELPSPPRESTFAGFYTLSTHIIPAAFPRTNPQLPAPGLPDESAPKEERKTKLKAVAAQISGARDDYESGKLGDEGSIRPLWCCLNRYVRKQSARTGGGSVTLFLTHGNGFPKEMWEPTLDALISRSKEASSGPWIEEIWCLDAVQHGDSALLNADNLGGLFDWSDYARDILQFLVYYLPDAASHYALPTHLPRIPEHDALARQSSGFDRRTLVGIGHSFGGTAMTLAAIQHPDLFSSLILIDPIITPPYGERTRVVLAPFLSRSIARRQRWPSRAAAYTYFRENPQFSAWHPAVLAAYIAHALYTEVGGGVRLKTQPVQEAIIYEKRSAYEAWALLPSLARRVQLHFVMPTSASVFGSPPEVAQELVWRRDGNTSNCIIDSGHLMPLEKPKELAEELLSFLEKRGSSIRPGTARL